AMGAPTLTVSPGCACSSDMTPAYGQGSSTAALAVSISTMTWLTLTLSPGDTCQRRISASVSPSPTSGNANCLSWDMAATSVRERAVDGVEYPVQVGQEVLFALARRVGGVETGHPQYRGLQGVEAFLLHAGRDLGGQRRLGRRLGHDHQVPGAAHRIEHRLKIER